MAQAPRSIAVTTDLGTDVLELRSFSGSEEMSRLFHFHLEMVCPDGEVKQNDVITKLVGKKVGIRLNLTEGERHFHGHFSRIAADYGEDGGTVYRAEMVPWLWFLTQTSDCRIFQNKDVKEILEIVFGDSDFGGDVDFKLTGSYPKWEYCVQYRETDFNFVSRLMEQVGIFYYFEHSEGQHKLVVTDGTSGYAKLPGPPVDLPFARQAGEDVNDHLTDWQHEYEFVSGKWAQTDYDFKKPKSNLAVNEETNLKHPDAKKYEIYDYPGEYIESGVGKNEVKVRMEEEEAPHNRVSATSSCRVFSAGGVFTVGKDHPSKDAQNQQFLITSIRHQASDDSYVGGTGGASYSNSFQCIPAGVTFRPARATPKPLVSGIQTAVVTGPEGEEIYTDKYGRVKVQFHWDREVDNPKMAGNKKEKRPRDQSSCFIRCAQNSAGKKWGFMSIPRIGQEVVIDFLEGDPDRPLIVGSVYNEDQLPHYDPEKPEHKTKTYFKTNSSKGGDGFNELMFDDAADKEQVFIHAEKDMDIRVKNHYKEHVTGNRHHIIDGEEGEGQRRRRRQLLGNHWPRSPQQRQTAPHRSRRRQCAVHDRQRGRRRRRPRHGD